MAGQKVKLFNSIDEAKKIIPDGQKRLVQIGEKNICLVNTGSEFIAFENECPHLGHPLHEGTLNPFGEIVCALHSYRFNLKSGNESTNRCGSIRFYTALYEDDKLFIEL